jgi:hypothetical protein
MDIFSLADGCGLEFIDFATAVKALIFCRGSLSLRDVAQIFDVEDQVVRKAVDENYWLLISGPDDDPTKQMIEEDGE